MIEFAGKTIFISGSCGTVGSEILRSLALVVGIRVICIDNNETELFFQSERYQGNDFSFHLCDIRDRVSLTERMRGADIVLHTAALKHVGLCEDGPTQAVQTNIIGTQNIIDAAIECDVERFIFTSSDKAVNPTSVMGTSKLMGERLVTAAAIRLGDKGPKFASTRFGNVLGSRGSVIPIFRDQIEAGKSLTLTDPEMTRFVMSLQEAANLVLKSVLMARSGEVFVTKMSAIYIGDLAKVMVDNIKAPKNIEIVQIGSKPGEKLFEELINEEEVRRTEDIGDFLLIHPALANSATVSVEGSRRVDKVYNSSIEEKMCVKNLKNYLTELGFI